MINLRFFIAHVCMVVLICVPILRGTEAEAADAVTVAGGIGTVQETLSAASNKISAIANKISAFATDQLAFKEFTLDTIAWQLSNVVIEQMIRSTTQWVNSGFQGEPAFVSDLGGFMLNIADEYALEFLWDGEALEFLCSPFSLDVKLALNLQYERTRDYRAQCSISDAIANVDGFLNGNFLDGGWDGWRSIALNRSNNPYGATLDAGYAMRAGIESRSNNELSLLTFGRGFLTQKDCDPATKQCETINPGAVIESQLNNTLSIPQGRLTISDELNELLGSLLGQLTSQILGGGGLRGLSDSQYGGGDYFTQDRLEQDPRGTLGSSPDSLEDAITMETTYVNTLGRVVSRITGTETYCSATHSRPLSTTLATARRDAQSTITNSSLMIADLTELLDDYETLSEGSTLPSTVSDLLLKYDAETVGGAKTEIMTLYSTMRLSGDLHTQTNTMELEQVTLFDPGSNPDYWNQYPNSIIAQIYVFQRNDCVEDYTYDWSSIYGGGFDFRF